MLVQIRRIFFYQSIVVICPKGCRTFLYGFVSIQKSTQTQDPLQAKIRSNTQTKDTRLM